ncbi:MAG: hypothetical protein KGL57_01240 [Burkholderiales bacterium]|nr:hypothetical protein [Burkholderiales bacterium]
MSLFSRCFSRSGLVICALGVVVATSFGLSASAPLAQAQSLRTTAQPCVCASTEDTNKTVIANCQCGSLQCVYAYGNQGLGNAVKQPALVCIK